MRLLKDRFQKIPWYLKPFFWNQKRKYGQYLEPAKVWASVPRLFLGVASIVGTLERKRSPVSPAIRSLVSIRVSQMNWCAFCVDLNSLTIMKRINNREKVDALENWRESELFSPDEAAALDYAELMTESKQQVTDSCFERLKLHFDDTAIIELTALISFQNMSSKFNSALGIEPQGLCKKK
ncbi:TPA: carboxymuconolactone decarboxylase family protein [Legionella pneumophila]|nr:carboxymuconolactone decarboxylase family protein [Legionella pneumophila]HAT8258186.1 carboxymuconolactone decarboxylase family protein [Legionella pneumophila]HAT8260488.1 carboxymuconolactone decarboxylase family protein [Legionella pneumophila]HAT8270676.1 carboxymuconolactone decarboxylase family protein [Legionella pneumophila]HAT8273801.1 carboxymuconolactone decarboxylase family protein [Legionella pneumophila]